MNPARPTDSAGAKRAIGRKGHTPRSATPTKKPANGPESGGADALVLAIPQNLDHRAVSTHEIHTNPTLHRKVDHQVNVGRFSRLLKRNCAWVIVPDLGVVTPTSQQPIKMDAEGSMVVGHEPQSLRILMRLDGQGGAIGQLARSIFEAIPDDRGHEPIEPCRRAR